MSGSGEKASRVFIAQGGREKPSTRGAEPDLTHRGVSGPYKAWVTSSLHVIGREYKTARGRSWRPSVIMAACTRHPTRPVPVPTGRSKSKKRPAEDAMEDKTVVLEEGELAACFFERDGSGHADGSRPVRAGGPTRGVDVPVASRRKFVRGTQERVCLCLLPEGHVSRVQSSRSRGRMDDPGGSTVA